MWAVLALLLLGANAWSLWGYNSKCHYTRQDAVGCFAKHVDLNKDGKITDHELQRALHYYGGYALRIARWISSWATDTRTKSIMKNCLLPQHAKRDYFTAEDFLGTEKTCLSAHWNICLIKMVCDDADRAENKRSTWF
jgi:hypothetical protein